MGWRGAGARYSHAMRGLARLFSRAVVAVAMVLLVVLAGLGVRGFWRSDEYSVSHARFETTPGDPGFQWRMWSVNMTCGEGHLCVMVEKTIDASNYLDEQGETLDGTLAHKEGWKTIW